MLFRDSAEDVILLAQKTIVLIDGLGFLQSLRACASQAERNSRFDPETTSDIDQALLNLRHWESSACEDSTDFLCTGMLIS